MSPELMLGAAFLPFWFLLVFIGGNQRFNLLWNPEYQGEDRFPGVASMLLVGARLLLFMHVASLILFSTGLVPPEYKIEATTLQLAILAIFAISADALLAWRRVLKERRAAGDSSVVHRRHNLITEMSITGVGMVLAFIALGQLLRGFQVLTSMSFFWIIFVLTQRTGFGGNLRGPTAPFDESPILDELRAIGKPFGVRLKELKTKRSRKNGSLYRVPILELVKEKKPMHGLVLPWENFIYLDPGTTTFSFAMRWASEVRPRTLAALIRSNIYVMFGVTFATVVAWFLLFAFTMKSLSGFTHTNRVTAGVMIFMGSLFIPLVLIFVVGRLMGFYPGWRRATVNAYEGWTAAEKWETRTLEDFVTAAAQYNAYQNQIFIAKVAMLQIRRNKRIRYLLKREGVTDTNALFERVEGKLTLPFIREEKITEPQPQVESDPQHPKASYADESLE